MHLLHTEGGDIPFIGEFGDLGATTIELPVSEYLFFFVHCHFGHDFLKNSAVLQKYCKKNAV